MSGKGKAKRGHEEACCDGGNILSPRFTTSSSSSPETASSDDPPCWSDSGASSGNDGGPFGPGRYYDTSEGATHGRRGEDLCWSPVVRFPPPSPSPSPSTEKHASGSSGNPPGGGDGEEFGWGADADAEEEDDDDDGRDEFLDDFARELDGGSSSGGGGGCGGEEDDDEELEKNREAEDMRVARAMQEEEWRRSPPPPGKSTTHPLFSIGGGNAGGGASTSSSTNSSARFISECGAIAAVSDGKGRGPGDHAEVSVGAENPERGIARGSSRVGREAFSRRGAGDVPPPWPPGGIKEGEGLPLNNLPDEILDKVAAFALLPRCVSRRIQRIRVKVVRERVIAALESSAKLPVEKAEEVEEAIFSLVGRLVGKAYKAKAREMSFNLRVGKNDPLRERVLSGTLSPGVLVRMTSDELAPLSVRRERERIARKRIREVTSSRDSPFHTATDRFTCPECAHEKTQYRTWRRKAVVDRVRVIVQCLQCRHSWEL